MHWVAGCPASWSAATHRLAWKQPLKSRLPGFPVARVSPASREFPPGRTSALAMNEFVLRSGGRAQGFLARNFKILPSRWEIHKKARVIPRERRLSTALSTVWSTAGSVRRDRERPRRARTPGPSRGSSGGLGLARRTREMSGNAAYISEAPPCMRWRGLAAAIWQGHRLLGYRGAIRPLHQGGKISPEGRFPGFPCARPAVPVSRSDGVRGPC